LNDNPDPQGQSELVTDDARRIATNRIVRGINAGNKNTAPVPILGPPEKRGKHIEQSVRELP